MAIYRGIGGSGDATGDAANASAIAIAAANEAEDSAIAAAASATTAAANALNYASTAAALADVGLVVGTQFSVVNGAYVDFYRKDTGPVATYLYSVAGAEYVAGLIGTSVIGHTQAASGLNTGTAIYYWPLTLSTYERRLKTIEASMPAAGQATLVVAFVEGDGSLTLVSSKQIPLRSGLNTISGFDVVVPAGCVVGLGGVPIYYESGAPTSIWFTAAVPTTSTAKTITATNPVRFRFTLDGLTRRQSDVSAVKTEELGAVQVTGWPSPIVSTGVTVPANYTIFDQRPVDEDGYLTAVTVGAAAGASSTLLVASITSAGVATPIICAAHVGAQNIVCRSPCSSIGQSSRARSCIVLCSNSL